MKRQKKEDLPDDIDALKQLVLAHRDRIQLLEEQIVLFKHREFGKSSEKCSQQAELFDEAECEIDEEAPLMAQAVDIDTTKITPPKAKSGRKPLPPSLPRVRIEHDLTTTQKICQFGCQKICIGEDTSEQLDIIPAVIQVLVHARKSIPVKPVRMALRSPHSLHNRYPKVMPVQVLWLISLLLNIKMVYPSIVWKQSSIA